MWGDGGGAWDEGDKSGLFNIISRISSLSFIEDGRIPEYPTFRQQDLTMFFTLGTLTYLYTYDTILRGIITGIVEIFISAIFI